MIRAEKLEHPVQRTAKILIIGAILLIILLPMFLVVRRIMPQQPNKDEVIKITGIGFPTALDLVDSHMTALNMELYAKMKCPRGDAERFAANVAAYSEVSRKERIDGLSDGAELSWWRPGSPRRFVALVVRPNGHFETRVLISLDGKDAVLYVYHSR